MSPGPSRILRALLIALALVSANTAWADRVVVLVDNSGSMRTSDANGLVPKALLGFAADLPVGTDLSVVAFDASARVLYPLAPASELTSDVLGRLDYRGQLTDPAAAVERGLYELREAPANAGRDAIVLLTDGVVDLGDPATSLRAEDWLLGDLSEQLVAADIAVWAIALTEGADVRMLNRLTRATDGEYFRAVEARDVDRAIRRIGEGLALAGGATTEPATRPARVAPAPVETRVARTPAATAPVVERPVTEQVVVTPAPRVAAPSTPGAEAVTRRDAPAVASEPASAPALPTSLPRAPGEERDLRWFAIVLMFAGVVLLGWVFMAFWREKRGEVTREEPALEYFPDCYLVDLHGVTDRPTHRLASKYNMITRLQNPPDDGINYIQVFRRQIGRRHALLEYRDFSFWLIDQDSLNGTFVNSERLVGETRLKHGDRLRFHIYEFEFCVSDLALSNETLIEQARAGTPS